MTHQKGNILELEGYLNQKTRVRIRDGRVFIGKFVCIDKQKNIILSQANEYRGGELYLDS
ncbi:hypothetical protein PHYBLDRAFT_107729 [Phycomyces blakesleeanus NRRL 1555(-)]|uniref:Sm domain-containing protein n=1 Tax=Phycomyces blakesleeanus (strain ATCC 8743b / DSM 1359 / FGSC 10004 / NBRC 33097 / NRRL 1555) TaxID=763407 RepID=A0A163B5P5_PHYB8|nr:hypothetical protein PHYBLDRAFT_107729 [Phycomyces blakesleeanus NRRL 1555(-)]OAD78401.1 hypothetical protein PHYBLDRAFT_107729 [Phycomyces blakesleeanus NRRL 1555(-)]|eukprot:XP_018296441.1 hypothetical protein PHYBLDRAFT_107729 [Phycomyces blakesleeanus NRRL 1555(-)]